MDDREKVIVDYQKEIVEIYKSKGLGSLSGINLTFEVNGHQILLLYSKVTRKGMIAHKEFDFNKCLDDLIFCSDEILHFTALLYLYCPYMNNPLNEGYQLGERVVYPNRQNLAAKRFSMFANSLNEKVYNYWDRIGDLIATYFPETMNPKQAYFGKTIDTVPAEFQASNNYKWLKDFKDGDFKKINEKRKQIVHYTTLDTQFKHSHLEFSDDKAMLQALIAERDSLPDFFRSHIQTTFDGFEKAMFLIEEITSAKLKEIE